MKELILILLASLTICILSAVSAIHVMPASYNPALDLELMLEITQDAQNLKSVTLQYRAATEGKWLEIAMREHDPGWWRASIPRGSYSTSEVVYRFVMELQNGSKTYLPDEAARGKAYLLAPKMSQGSKSDAFVLLNEEASISSDEDYILAVSYMSIAEDLDPTSLRVFVGDRDVTKLAQVSGSTLLYRESKPRPGIKKALVMANVKGKELYSETWITQITPGSRKIELPFTVRGSLNLAANAYASSAEDISFGNTLSDFATWTDLYGRYGMLDITTKLYLSSLEEANRQPVNRYTFGLQLPWLDLFLGDYSPELSEYTLSGRNIRGLYSQLDTQYLRVSWALGESVRKTLQPANAEQPSSGTFKQEAIGARIAIGLEDGFTLGFSGSRHRDIISSLDPAYYQFIAEDGELQYSSKAQDNAVFAVDARLNVPDQQVMMGVEVAASLLNSNTIPGTISDDELSDYGIDLDMSPSDFEDFFVINKNLKPFGLGKGNIAGKAYISMYVLKNMINVEYQQTGSAFNSLGSYASLNDSKMLSISDQIAIGRILFLSGSYSQTDDNLMGYNTENNSYRNIQAQAILRYPNLPYLKAAIYNNVSENSENKDLETDNYVPYSGESQFLSVGLGYNFVQIPYVPTQLDISIRTGDDSRELKATDLNDLELLSNNQNNGFNISMSNRFLPFPLKTQFSYSTAKNTNMLDDLDYKNSRLHLRAEYAFLHEALKPYVAFSSTSLSGAQDAQTYSSTAFGLEAYPLRKLSVSTDLSFKAHSNKDDPNKEYNTTTWRLLISQRF